MVLSSRRAIYYLLKNKFSLPQIFRLFTSQCNAQLSSSQGHPWQSVITCIHITIRSDGVKICLWLSRFSQGNTFYASMTCFHEMLFCALYWTRSKSSLVSKLILPIVLLDFIFDSGLSDSKNADSFSRLNNANIFWCMYNRGFTNFEIF